MTAAKPGVIVKFAKGARDRAAVGRLLAYVGREDAVRGCWSVSLGARADDLPPSRRADLFAEVALTLGDGVHRPVGRPRYVDHAIISFSKPIDPEDAGRFVVRLGKENRAIRGHAMLAFLHEDAEAGRSHLHLAISSRGHGDAGSLSSKLDHKGVNLLYANAHRLAEECLGIEDTFNLEPLGRENRPRSISARKRSGLTSQIAKERIRPGAEVEGVPPWLCAAVRVSTPRVNFDRVVAAWSTARSRLGEMRVTLAADSRELVGHLELIAIETIAGYSPDRAKVTARMIGEVVAKRRQLAVDQASAAISRAESASNEIEEERERSTSRKFVIPRFRRAPQHERQVEEEDIQR